MRRVLLVAVLLLVAGCSAPTQTTPAAQTQSTTPDAGSAATGTLTYDGANLAYNGTRVLRDVERLRGLNATGTITVSEFSGSTSPPYDVPDRFASIRQAGAVALGLYTNATARAGQALGVTYAGPLVRIRTPGTLDRFPQQVVLAHELTHALQYQHGFRAVRLATSGVLETDGSLAVRAVVEGDAELTAVQYRNESFPETPLPVTRVGNVTRARWQYAFSASMYQYGYQYYRSVGTTVAARNTSLSHPPQTTRGLLHPGINDTRPSLPDSPQSARFDAVHADTIGELGVRLALRANGVSKQNAARAAFGWRNDRMTYYGHTRNASVRWLSVWQNDTEAREFANAWTTMLGHRNASLENGAYVVPATNTTPRFVSIVHRVGKTVLVTAGTNASRVRALAHLSSSRNVSNSSSTASSSTSATASSTASSVSVSASAASASPSSRSP